MKKTQSRKEKLEKELAEVKEIAGRDLLQNTTFREVYLDSDFPPYCLSLLAFDSLTEDAAFEPVADKTEDGRVRGKGEKAILNGLSRVGAGCGYVVGGYTALFVGALTTPISLPRLACCGIKSAINKNYNKRIEKARGRVKEIESELKTLNAQSVEAEPQM
ncbi:MAG: hypothetical protein IJX17_02665 [Clostridia bacterium]|nr:hypothetical protein [Clostridia bacterium]